MPGKGRPWGKGLPLLLVGLLLALASCGDRPPVPRAKELGPELYVIAEDDRPEPGQFLRYVAPGPGGGGLDIAITDYARPEGGPTLALFGVVHVADAPYFDAVQEALDTYDLVLYEAVKPKEADVVEWQQSAMDDEASLAGFQLELASWFGFRFQLAALDYSRPHFRHADMTLEEFKQAGGGEFVDVDEPEDEASWDTLPKDVRGVFDAVRAFGEKALSKPNPLRSLARKMFAQAMGTMDIGTTLEMVPGMAQLVLYDRNDVVMDFVRSALEEDVGTVAVFYGAAHMPDLEEKLTAELGYERADGRWLRAWALRAPLVR